MRIISVILLAALALASALLGGVLACLGASVFFSNYVNSFDLVINHASSAHRLFQDFLENISVHPANPNLGAPTRAYQLSFLFDMAPEQQKVRRTQTAVVHAWRAQGWFVNMYEISSVDKQQGTISWADKDGMPQGGWQGGHPTQAMRGDFERATAAGVRVGGLPGAAPERLVVVGVQPPPKPPPKMASPPRSRPRSPPSRSPRDTATVFAGATAKEAMPGRVRSANPERAARRVAPPRGSQWGISLS